MKSLESITRREFINNGLKGVLGFYLASNFFSCIHNKPVEYHSISFKETPRKIQLYQTQTKGGRSITKHYYLDFDDYTSVISVKIRPEFNRFQSTENAIKIFYDALNKEEVEVYGRIIKQNTEQKNNDGKKFVFIDKIIFKGQDYNINYK